MDDIDRIRRDHGLDLTTTDREALQALTSLKSNLSNSLRNLSEELYTKDLHFLMEFIQNADDNSYQKGVTPTLDIDLSQNRITIRCNEVGFTSQNLQAICSVGKSTKTNLEGYIGEKGIGFKAVFTVADVVHVRSGSYSFKFDNSGSEELGMITPIRTTCPVEAGWTTFVLHIPSRIDLGSLSKRLSEVQPTLLLFLRKLRHLHVSTNGSKHRLSRKDNGGMTSLCSNGDEKRYLVVKHAVNRLPEEPKRLNVTTSEIVLAFPLSPRQEPIAVDQDVHTFLPLRSFGLKFIIQADFLTTSNREDILANRPWNQVLRDAIPDAFCRAIEQFGAHPGLKFNWLQYIPRHIPDGFMKPIVKGIKGRVQLLGADGNSCPPTTLIIVPNEYLTESSPPTPLVPEHEFKGKLRYLAQSYNTARDASVLQHLGVETMTPTNFIDGLNLMGARLHAQNHHWLERVCSTLRSLANQWRSSYKGRIQALSLVPLRGGSWENARASDVFFADDSVSDVPPDLPLRFVRMSKGDRSEHCGLLRDLGVKEASTNEIVQQILASHGLWSTPDASAVLAHAKFIFQHANRFSESLALNVLCEDNQLRPAESVYMDQPASSGSPKLSGVLGLHGAPFLHRTYYTAFHRSFENQRWFTWLQDILQVNTIPRVQNHDLCAEFWTFVANTPSPAVLVTLQYHWDQLWPGLQNARIALDKLSALEVLCSDGLHRRLDSTYLGRSTLRRFTNLPFVDVPEPDQRGWDFLARLGVTFAVDSMFYLKQLIDRSHGPGDQIKTGDIVDLYIQLSARFEDDGKQEKIRDAFRIHPLIYVPPSHRIGQSQGRWVSSQEVFWDGPRSVISKTILEYIEVYRPLQKLFAQQLQIPPPPIDILWQELREISKKIGGDPLDPDNHRIVFAILKDIDDVIDIKRKSINEPSFSWLTQLQNSPIFPATSPVGDLRLYDASKVYNPLGGKHLVDLFLGRVPILEAPRDERLGVSRLGTLLSSHVCSHMKVLCEEVHKEVIPSGTRMVDASSSERYLLRWPSVQRLALGRRRASPNIGNLKDLVVYDVQELSCRYTLDDVSTEPEPQVFALGLDQEKGLITVLRCTTENNRESNDLGFAKAIAHEWALSFADTLLVITASEAGLDMFFQENEIPDLDSLLRGDIRSGATWTTYQELKPSTNHSVSKNAANVKGPSMCGALLPPTGGSHRKTELEARPAYVVEWQAFMASHESKVYDAAREHDLSSNVAYLEELFAPPAMSPFTTVNVPESFPTHADSIESCVASVLESLRPSSGNGTGFRTSSQGFGSGYGSSRAPHSTEAASEPNAEEMMTGALGELFVYQMLQSMNLPGFSVDSWTSKLRHYASNFQFERYTQPSTADFVYHDAAGVLTKVIFGEESNVVKRWSSAYPRYHLEVKSTAGGKCTPFLFDRRQFQIAGDLTVRDWVGEKPPTDIYVLVRVWNVRTNDLSGIRCEAYPDPHKLFYNCKLRVDSDRVSVSIQE